jgi:membrane protein implicated in regulation of membrane protease activity
MAETLRLGIFLVALVIAAIAFFNLASPWAWLVPIVVAILGGLIAERLFKRLASPAEIQRDLEDRTRNPPL